MEDLFGLLVFVVVTVLSIANRSAKEKEAQQKKSKGPLRPTREGKRKKPSWPFPLPPVAPSGPEELGPWRPQPKTQPQMKPKPQLQSAEDSWESEGVSTQQAPLLEELAGKDVRDEAARFNRSNQIGEFPESRFQSSLDLSKWTEDAGEQRAVPTVGEAPSGMGLKQTLAQRSSLAQAVVMAEVLGKPKALRRRGK